MSYHWTAYGAFGAGVRAFADLHGYVPEPGDDPTAFHYPAGFTWTPSEWRAWCEAADVERQAADRAVRRWQGAADADEEVKA